MSGELAGEALEQALKADVKDRAMDPGTKHAGPQFIESPEVKRVLADALERDAARAGDIARFKGVTPSNAMGIARALVKEERPLGDLPAGIRSVLFVPVKQGDDTTSYQVSVDGFGYRTKGESRNKMKALAYALEEMVEKMLEDAANG